MMEHLPDCDQRCNGDWCRCLCHTKPMTTEALPLTCDGCGQRTWDRADMLEAHFPEVTAELVPGVFITPLTLGWVGPCCAELANHWQPGDPEEAGPM